jgi:hypothetical protein
MTPYNLKLPSHIGITKSELEVLRNIQERILMRMEGAE